MGWALGSTPEVSSQWQEESRRATSPDGTERGGPHSAAGRIAMSMCSRRLMMDPDQPCSPEARSPPPVVVRRLGLALGVAHRPNPPWPRGFALQCLDAFEGSEAWDVTELCRRYGRLVTTIPIKPIDRFDRKIWFGRSVPALRIFPAAGRSSQRSGPALRRIPSAGNCSQRPDKHFNSSERLLKGTFRRLDPIR